MPHFPSIAAAAALIADPTRATMLAALMDGRALPAGELARVGGVTAQTASSHLIKLLEGGLILVETEGRHRYYRLANIHVAQTLEHLAAMRPTAPERPKALSPQLRQMRFCRTCYDHLAGQVGIAVTGALIERDYLRSAADKQFLITPGGKTWFESLGVDLATTKPSRRSFARQCLDWTERTHHLAGPLGTRLLSTFCTKGWLRRSETSRIVTVTPKGWIALKQNLGLSQDIPDLAPK